MTYVYPDKKDVDPLGSVVADSHKENDLIAGLSILRTFFISVVLAASSMLFSQDIEELILNPLEKML